MIGRRTRQKVVDETYPTKYRCDICGKEFENIKKNIIQIQEMYQIKFTGGYGSIFGDGNEIECDICQECLMNMIKGKYRVAGNIFFKSNF
jgi:hypothetical protein